MARMVDYPTTFGDKRISCFTHKGPASYAAIVNGTPPTGGDTVTAAEAGIKAFDALLGGMTSDNGQFIVQGVSPNGNPLSPWGVQPAITMKLRWLTAATGAEVAGATDLSARTIRLCIVGPK